MLCPLAAAIGPLEVVILAVMLGIPLMIAVRVSRWMSSRPCPRCGERVTNGKLKCQECGYDFDAATRAGVPD